MGFMKFYQPFLPNEKLDLKPGKVFPEDSRETSKRAKLVVRYQIAPPEYFQLFRASLTIFFLSNIVELTRCSFGTFQFAKIDVRDCVRVFTKHQTRS